MEKIKAENFNAENFCETLNKVKNSMFGEHKSKEFLACINNITSRPSIWMTILQQHKCIIKVGRGRYVWKPEPININLIKVMHEEVRNKSKEYSQNKEKKYNKTIKKEPPVKGVQITPEYCEQYLLKLGYKVYKPRPIQYDEITLSE